MQPVGNDDKDSGGRLRPICFLLAMFAIFFGYPLSIGPFQWAFQHGYVSKSLGTIYFPLVLLADHSDLVNGWMQWYLKFWD